ncbi:DUF4974 domain-containing protein [Puteibacter caeruleilacunae]|nr:DUF4974 domain-containing protein [Puteibacter caeruleilacunae]
MEKDIENIIGKCLSKNANQKEIDYINSWRKESEDNEEEFRQYEKIWTSHDGSFTDIDYEKAYQNTLVKLSLQHQSPAKKWLLTLQRVAAILLIPLVIWTIYDFTKEDTKEVAFEIASSGKQLSECILPDGSKVWLNSDSKIKYSTKGDHGERRVELNGEAYFDVAKDKERAFVVRHQNNRVKVFGTRFNVNTNNNDHLEVTLEEGSIGLFNKKRVNNMIMVKPGYHVVITHEGQLVSKEKLDTYAVTSWRDGKYVFKDEPLENIARKIERLYDVEVIFKDESLRNYRYRGVLEFDNSVFHALKVLKYSSEVNYEMHGRKVYLYK